MTATVISLSSRRPDPKQPCACPRHQLDALAGRVRDRLDQTEGSLLVARDDLAAVLADIRATTDRLIPSTERTAP